MNHNSLTPTIKNQQRTVTIAQAGDNDLGPLRLLPGIWKNTLGLNGHGWNMIALPFAPSGRSSLNYRLLLNQYNEELKFTLVDKAVPNRGIRNNGTITTADQFIVTLDYEQKIEQIDATDFPLSGLAGGNNLPIHHEPGLWLYMTNETTKEIDVGETEKEIDIGRLATIPHGDSVLALGTSERSQGPPNIPTISGLPVGVPPNLKLPYLSPYVHFHNNPFGNLFDPVNPNDLLRKANKGVSIRHTTTLEVDTEVRSGGIVNIPFIVRQANAVAMKSTFWIQELEDETLRLQYSQIVMLDFFKTHDGSPGLISWPHVSINTMEKVANTATVSTV